MSLNEEDELRSPDVSSYLLVFRPERELSNE
jgi:hypothetical protein